MLHLPELADDALQQNSHVAVSGRLSCWLRQPLQIASILDSRLWRRARRPRESHKVRRDGSHVCARPVSFQLRISVSSLAPAQAWHMVGMR